MADAQKPIQLLAECSAGSIRQLQPVQFAPALAV